MFLTVRTEEPFEFVREFHAIVLRWFTFAILVIFALGILFSLPAHAQAPNPYTNAANIADVDGKVKVLETKVTSLGDLAIQFQALRERMIAMELTQKESAQKIDEIYGAKNWLVFAVFGILINEAMKRLKFRGPPD